MSETSMSDATPLAPFLAFDVDALRRRYPDLTGMSDDELRAHYETHGRREGRVASDVALRDGLIGLVSPEADVLEIGPYCSPAFAGERVRYLDVFDSQTLRDRAAAAGLDAAQCPEIIHYTHGLGSVPASSCDVVFSSHAIEHQPDLIRHLQEVSAVLRPGGAFLLVVPDKRYCFDHHLPLTPINEVFAAYAERRTRHTARNLLDYVVHQTHNDPVAHWRGEHGAPTDADHQRLRWALDHYAEADGGYIDVHAWRLTPDSFREIIETVSDLALCRLSTAAICDTPWGEFQFIAILKKSA